MPDAPSQRYRFWGSIEPPADREPLRAQVVPKTDGTGKSATIRVYDPIDSWGGSWGISAKEFAAAMDSMGDDIDEINLLINSPGGECFEAIAIMNMLRASNATVNATVEGLAASAASFLAASADNTVMAPNSQMMIHEAWGLVVGPAADMHAYAAVLDKLSDNLAAIYASSAGGTAEGWRAVMSAETWYTADEAVEAGLAQSVAKPKPSDVAAKSRFDLSIFNHAGRADAPAPAMPAKASTAPAKPPVVPPTPKEADAMSDTIIKGLRERLGIADDVVMDDEAVLARYDELTAEAATALAAKTTTEPVKATVPEGYVLVDQDVIDELKAGAKAGAEARAAQMRAERDETIAAAVAGGHIAPARRDHWAAKWDKDPEGVKASIVELTAGEPIFPVALAGSAGSETDFADAPFTDDEADQLGALAGLPKGALR